MFENKPVPGIFPIGELLRNYWKKNPNYKNKDIKQLRNEEILGKIENLQQRISTSEITGGSSLNNKDQWKNILNFYSDLFDERIQIDLEKKENEKLKIDNNKKTNVKSGVVIETDQDLYNNNLETTIQQSKMEAKIWAERNRRAKGTSRKAKEET